MAHQWYNNTRQMITGLCFILLCGHEEQNTDHYIHASQRWNTLLVQGTRYRCPPAPVLPASAGRTGAGILTS